MGFFDFFKTPDINQELITFHNTKGGVLLDVRTPQEYREGHVPGSKNVPLQAIDTIRQLIAAKDTPLFVYCHSGARSSHATAMLGKMGYTNVKNIGGIVSYKGKVDK
ncbi:MAG: rhodanese-like domain-containing protein [Firmicutes bacterium]|nr:rhodanese-like domain-containing protein [Bacillota bacterium]